MPTFIAIGDCFWGKGKTPNEALKQARSQTGRKLDHFMIFLVGEKSTVTDMGWISFDVDGPKPVELYHVVKGKQVPVPTPEPVKE